MLSRACLRAFHTCFHSTAAYLEGLGLMHSGPVTRSHTRSAPYPWRQVFGLRPTCKLPISRKPQHNPVSCRAFASTPTVGDTTHSDQKKLSKFVHNLSEEQAAAALAGDGHLRY